MVILSINEMDEPLFMYNVASQAEAVCEREHIPQGIQNKLSYNGMVAVEGVPTTRIIIEFTLFKQTLQNVRFRIQIQHSNHPAISKLYKLV